MSLPHRNWKLGLGFYFKSLYHNQQKLRRELKPFDRPTSCHFSHFPLWIIYFVYEFQCRFNAYNNFFLINAITKVFFYFSGISKEGPPSRHLLPTLAISRPPVAPRIKSSRALWLCFSSAKGRSLCQSLSLHKNRSANSAASSRTYKYKKQRSKFRN